MTSKQHEERVRDRLDGRSLTNREQLRSSATKALIVVVALVTTMDVLLITPSFPAIQTAFGISETRVSLVVTVYAIPSVFVAPVVGYLADKLGRRRVLVACLSVFGIAGSLITTASGFHTVLLLRAVQGVAAGSILASLALTLVGDYFEGETHDAMMGITAAALSVGAAVYPTVGGYLSTISWRAPFAVYSICVPLALAAYVILEADSPPEPSDSGYLIAAMRELPFGQMAQAYGLLAVGFVVMFGGVYVSLPLFLRSEFGLTSVEVGFVSTFILGITAVISTQSGRIRGKVSHRGRLVIGFGVFGGGTAVTGTVSAIPLIVVALASVGVGLGVLTPTLFAVISDLAPQRFRAGVMSLRTTTVGISQAIGPALFTEFSQIGGYQPVFLASGIALLIVTLLLLRTA